MGQNYNAVVFFVGRTTLLCQKLFRNQEKAEVPDFFFFFFCGCVLYNTIDKTNVLSNESALKKVGLVAVNKVRKNMFESVSDRLGCYFIIAI